MSDEPTPKQGGEGPARPGRTGKRSDRGDHAPHRLAAALRLLANGGRYIAVRDELMATFKISRATAERDIARAYAEITAEAEAERPTMAARIVDRAWRLMLRAESRKEDHLALAALDRLIKLHGLGAERAVIGGRDDLEHRALLDALRLTPPQQVAEMLHLRELKETTTDERNEGNDSEE